MTSRPISISQVDVPEEAQALVLDVLRSGRLAQGPMVERLEELGAQMAGTTHCLAVNNGTTALVVALEALELEPGDEVVTSPFTFVATINAILEAGATVRFADIGSDYCIDPELVSDRLGPRSRVVMPVHLYGLPADLPRLTTVAAAANLAIVEDAAQAHGAAIGDRPVGGAGLGCFSLYGTKNVTTGEGGLVTTDDDALADRIRLLRNQGMRMRYQYEVPGHNYRLTDLQAAVGIPQLERLGAINSARAANAARLTDGLAEIPGLTVPSAPPDRTHVWHQYTVRIGSDARIGRDELIDALERAEIGSGIYYPRPVYDYDCYRTHPRVVLDPCPVTEQVAAEVVSLPVHPGLTTTDIDRVVDTVRSLLC